MHKLKFIICLNNSNLHRYNLDYIHIGALLILTLKQLSFYTLNNIPSGFFFKGLSKAMFKIVRKDMKHILLIC